MKRLNTYIIPSLFFIWSALLIYFAIRPIGVAPGSGSSSTFRWDYLEHLVAFGLFSYLYVTWRFRTLSSKKEVAIFLLVGTVYATFTELIQHFTVDRTLNPIDLLFNLLGLFTGLFATLFLFKRILKIT